MLAKLIIYFSFISSSIVNILLKLQYFKMHSLYKKIYDDVISQSNLSYPALDEIATVITLTSLTFAGSAFLLSLALCFSKSFNKFEKTLFFIVTLLALVPQFAVM